MLWNESGGGLAGPGGGVSLLAALPSREMKLVLESWRDCGERAGGKAEGGTGGGAGGGAASSSSASIATFTISP